MNPQESITYDPYYNVGSISWGLWLRQRVILKGLIDLKDTLPPEVHEVIPEKATGLQSGQWTTFTGAWQKHRGLDVDECCGKRTVHDLCNGLGLKWNDIYQAYTQGPSLHKGDDDKFFKFRPAQKAYRGIREEFPFLTEAAISPQIFLGSIGRQFHIRSDQNGTRREDAIFMKGDHNITDLAVASHNQDYLEEAVDAWNCYPEHSKVHVRPVLLARSQSAYDLIALCSLLPSLYIAFEN